MHSRRSRLASTLTLAAALLVAACVQVAPSSGTTSPSATQAPATDAQPSAAAAGSLFDDSAVHAVSVAFDEAEFQAMLATYSATGDKEWLESAVTIDGVTYQGVGMRLKGNSSLRGLTGNGGRGGESTPTSAEELPWLIDLDHFVDGQNHQGVSEFVIRSNSSETALNEALALDLLERAGLASQDAVAVRFAVNDGEAVLRLAIENPDDLWMSARFDTSGALYKAESTGDYSYRGEDEAAYDDVFDQEAGKDNTDLTPLIEFLDFINNADDATFAAELEQRLDVDAFATYLAMQELLDNFDDIDGPGNNSYLYYDSATGQFTVVPWDYNLAFGATPGGGSGPGMGGPGQGGPGMPPGGLQIDPPQGFDPPFVVNGGGPRGRSNVLVERFGSIDEYSSLVEQKQAELEAALMDSGVAADELARWVGLLKAQAADLVDAATVDSEAARINNSIDTD